MQCVVLGEVALFRQIHLALPNWCRNTVTDTVSPARKPMNYADFGDAKISIDRCFMPDSIPEKGRFGLRPCGKSSTAMTRLPNSSFQTTLSRRTTKGY